MAAVLEVEEAIDAQRCGADQGVKHFPGMADEGGMTTRPTCGRVPRGKEVRTPASGLQTTTTLRYNVTDASGNVSTYAYDGLNRLTSSVQKNSGGATLASYGYVYDNAGNSEAGRERGLSGNYGRRHQEKVEHVNLQRAWNTYRRRSKLVYEDHIGWLFVGILLMIILTDVLLRPTSFPLQVVEGSSLILLWQGLLGWAFRRDDGTPAIEARRRGVGIEGSLGASASGYRGRRRRRRRPERRR